MQINMVPVAAVFFDHIVELTKAVSLGWRLGYGMRWYEFVDCIDVSRYSTQGWSRNKIPP